MDQDKTFRLGLDYGGQHYDGTIMPSEEIGKNGMPVYFRVAIGDELFAYLCCADKGWSEREGTGKPEGLVNAIGNYIMEHYA